MKGPNFVNTSTCPATMLMLVLCSAYNLHCQFSYRVLVQLHGTTVPYTSRQYQCQSYDPIEAWLPHFDVHVMVRSSNICGQCCMWGQGCATIYCITIYCNILLPIQYIVCLKVLQYIVLLFWSIAIYCIVDLTYFNYCIAVLKYCNILYCGPEVLQYIELRSWSIAIYCTLCFTVARCTIGVRRPGKNPRLPGCTVHSTYAKSQEASSSTIQARRCNFLFNSAPSSLSPHHNVKFY
jgi:hypothetical protein